MSKNKDSDNEAIKEEKRDLVLKSINFYKIERNKALFQILAAKTKKNEALGEEIEAIKRSKLLKKRLLDEVNNNIGLLNKDDLSNFKREDNYE
jgi:hypothetical protein